MVQLFIHDYEVYYTESLPYGEVIGNDALPDEFFEEKSLKLIGQNIDTDTSSVSYFILPEHKGKNK